MTPQEMLEAMERRVLNGYEGQYCIEADCDEILAIAQWVRELTQQLIDCSLCTACAEKRRDHLGGIAAGKGGWQQRAETAEAERETLRITCDAYIYTVEELEAERDEALAQLREERAVCICGCPEELHDSLGEDGEACDDVTHECMRVAAGIGAAFVETRNRAEKAEAEVAKLLAERDADRPHEARWQEEHSYHTRVMARHEATIAALRTENAKLREALMQISACETRSPFVIAAAALAEMEEKP